MKEITDFRFKLVLDDSLMAGYQDLSVRRIKTILAGGDINELTALYRIMLTKDSHIASEIKRRKSRVRAQNMVAKSSNEKTQAALDALFATSEPKKTLDKLLSALEYGFFVGQLYYDTQLHLNPIHQTHLYYDQQGFYFYDAQGAGYRLDDRFMAFSLFEQPLREASLLYSLIHLFTAKHFVLGNYLKFAELLGVPPIIINTTDSDASSEIIKNALDLKSGGVGVFAKDDMVKVLEGKGTQAEFMEFIKYCDSQISLVISGNTLTSNSDGKGSLALGKVHENSQQYITQEDCYFFADQLEVYLGLRLALEGFDTTDLQVSFEFEKDTDLKARAETLAILANMGVDIPIDYINSEFNLPTDTQKTTPSTPVVQANERSNHDKNEKNNLSSVQPVRTAACACDACRSTQTNNKTNPKPTARNAITQALQQTLDAIETEQAGETPLFLNQIEHMIGELDKAQSYDEAIASTLEAFENTDMTGFIMEFSRMLANAHLAGRAEVQDEQR